MESVSYILLAVTSETIGNQVEKTKCIELIGVQALEP